MKDNKVNSVTIDEWLMNLRSREWLIPQFQRDFVWSLAECAEFAQSVLAGRPIGMVTIWEQPDDNDLPLEPVTLVAGAQAESFAKDATNPRRFYAVLDGRQRSQAVAMTFGGLRLSDRRSKFAGRFFLDANEIDGSPKVIFVLQSLSDKRELRREVDFIAKALFPLSSEVSDEGTVSLWVRYSTAMNDPATYPGNVLPEASVLSKRKRIVQEAFDGLTRTRLAVYTVPSRYQLGEICEIFETLNTTGTKVSTVDLIHSTLYSETFRTKEPMLLRDWIGEMGEQDGSVGWASKKDRPELFVQIVAGCYLAEKNPPPPRKTSGSSRRVNSIKASDLLALPTQHWLAARDRSGVISEALRDFQRTVGDGSAAFPFSQTPYPVTSGLYVGLRWKLETESTAADRWGIADLDALFRAFFWQTALRNRYDQGFLTQFSTDLAALSQILDRVPNASSRRAWAEDAEDRLTSLIGPMQDEAGMVSSLLDGRATGAIEKAMTLPMRCRVKNDLLDPDVSFNYPESVAELHHIYPRQWCRDNEYGLLREYLKKNDDRDPVTSVANLMPLGRASNNDWRARNPTAVIQDRRITFESHRELLRAAFIDEVAFKYLLQGAEGVIPFWEYRAQLMAQDLIRRTHVTGTGA